MPQERNSPTPSAGRVPGAAGARTTAEENEKMVVLPERIPRLRQDSPGRDWAARTGPGWGGETARQEEEGLSPAGR